MINRCHGNLKHCTRSTQERVLKVLNDPATRKPAIDMILAGLENDCVDVVADAELALKVLRMVLEDL